ncbi:hypothetical protein ACFQ0C_02410 [Paenibacillus sp. GCM10027630]
MQQIERMTMSKSLDPMYTAFGLTLQSEIELRELLRTSAQPKTADMTIRQGRQQAESLSQLKRSLWKRPKKELNAYGQYVDLYKKITSLRRLEVVCASSRHDDH